jgi:hypothetical protein
MEKAEEAEVKTESEGDFTTKGTCIEEMREGWWSWNDAADRRVKAGFYEDDAMIFGITYDDHQKPNGYWEEQGTV